MRNGLLAAVWLSVVTALAAGATLQGPPASGVAQATAGQAVYANNCTGCHLASGKGRPPAIPALEGNERLKDLPSVARYIREGRGAMPPFRRLSEADLAAVAAYIRSAWGNDFGAVDVDGVAAIVRQLQAPAPQPAASSAGWYTDQQADRGKDQYMERCAECHGADFVPDDFATGLTGAAFQWQWADRTAFDLFETIRTTMPPGEEGSLGPQATADIVAYLLKSNGFPAGTTELRPVGEALQQIRLKR